MKKLLMVLFLLICFTGMSVSAWEAEDLTKFPPCMDENSTILNLGLGLDRYFLDYLGDSEYTYIPPIRLSFDFNSALGDKNLPFFLGGLVIYSGLSYKDKNKIIKDWSYHVLRLGFRFGYHFNWGVDKLDTYAVSTAGWTIHLGDKTYASTEITDLLLIDVHFGARWFVSDGFGFWAEGGFGSSWLSAGLAFKF